MPHCFTEKTIGNHGPGVARARTCEPVGFIGYHVFEDLGPEPQLLYAFLERVTGRGFATELPPLTHLAIVNVKVVYMYLGEQNEQCSE